MKWDEDEVGGLGFAEADEPQALLATGVEETGDFPEANFGLS